MGSYPERQPGTLYSTLSPPNGKRDQAYEVGTVIMNALQSPGEPVGWVCTGRIEDTLAADAAAGATLITVADNSQYQTTGDVFGYIKDDGEFTWIPLGPKSGATKFYLAAPGMPEDGTAGDPFIVNQWRPIADAPSEDVVETLEANSSTPTVTRPPRLWKTANTNPTTLTNFMGGYTGQTIRVVINDANTTIDFTGTNLKGNGGADWSPSQGDFMVCTYDGTNWYCEVHET
jgi:hypothetical protein